MVLANAVNANTTGFQSLNASTGVWNGRTLQPGAGINITNGDGTGGDPVITNIGGVPDPFSTVSIVDDFIACNINSPVGNLNWTSTGTTFQNGTAANPGQVLVGLNGGASAISMGAPNDSALPFFLGGGSFTIQFIINISALTTGKICLGLMTGSLSAEPTDGVYFFYASGTNSGNWVGKTANASSRSSANSNVAIVANAWVKLKIVINSNATSVSFFVNNVEISNSPLTTNIPTSGLALRVMSPNIGASSIIVDLVTLTNNLTVSR